MNRDTKRILKAALDRVEVADDGLEPFDNTPSFLFVPSLGVIANECSEQLPEESQLEDILVWALLSLERIDHVKGVNASVDAYYASRGEGEPLRTNWWKYGPVGTPESLRQYVPKRERAAREMKAVMARIAGGGE